MLILFFSYLPSFFLPFLLHYFPFMFVLERSFLPLHFLKSYSSLFPFLSDTDVLHVVFSVICFSLNFHTFLEVHLCHHFTYILFFFKRKEVFLKYCYTFYPASHNFLCLIVQFLDLFLAQFLFSYSSVLVEFVFNYWQQQCLKLCTFLRTFHVASLLLTPGDFRVSLVMHWVSASLLDSSSR